VRYRHFGRQFCSDAGGNRCRQRYLAHHAHELSVRLRNIGLMIVGLFRKIGGALCALNFADVADVAKPGAAQRSIETPHSG